MNETEEYIIEILANPKKIIMDSLRENLYQDTKNIYYIRQNISILNLSDEDIKELEELAEFLLI